MTRFQTAGTTGNGGWVRRAMVFVAALSAVGVGLLPSSGRLAFAQVTDPTTTTEPAPETTTTTTTPAPDTTTTTTPAPDTTTTTDGGGATTTTSAPSSTTAPSAPEPQAGKLDAGEALVPRPEFGALTGHQRALVQELQTDTDTYALRRFALVERAQDVATAKGALTAAEAAETTAVMHEILVLADATESHRGVAAIRRLSSRSDNGRKEADRARVAAQDALAAANAQLAAQTAAVADAWAARSGAEAAIEQELGSDAVRARPDGITATLVAVQAGQPDPPALGGIGQPIPGAALASPFGLRNDPLSDGAGFHPGIDLAAGAGTPIHAAAAGVVVMAGDCGGYGNCVVIDHGDSLATLYAHQSQVLVGTGQHVDAGAVIGLVGSTGMATGPHLHFELRLHGLPIDPVLALPVG